MLPFKRSATAVAIMLGAALGASAGIVSAQPVPAASPVPGMTPMPVMTPLPMSTPLMSPSPSSSASAFPVPANPPENALVTDRVRAEFLAWQQGHIDRTRYSPYAGGTNSDALVNIERPYLAIGSPQTVTYQTTSLLLDDLVYRYDITGATGDTVAVLYALDQTGKIDGIVFTPQVFRSAPTKQ